jgi:hypothetical protein
MVHFTEWPILQVQQNVTVMEGLWEDIMVAPDGRNNTRRKGFLERTLLFQPPCIVGYLQTKLWNFLLVRESDLVPIRKPPNLERHSKLMAFYYANNKVRPRYSICSTEPSP